MSDGDPVELAMALLLSKRQIAAVRERTRYGPSRIQAIRQLMKLGVEAHERDEAQVNKWHEELRQRDQLIEAHNRKWNDQQRRSHV